MIIEKSMAKLEMDFNEYSTMVNMLDYAITNKENNIKYLKSRSMTDDRITPIIENNIKMLNRWKSVKELFHKE